MDDTQEGAGAARAVVFLAGGQKPPEKLSKGQKRRRKKASKRAALKREAEEAKEKKEKDRAEAHRRREELREKLRRAQIVRNIGQELDKSGVGEVVAQGKRPPGCRRDKALRASLQNELGRAGFAGTVTELKVVSL